MNRVPNIPPRSELRRLLEQSLRTSSDLDAFCVDYFSEVQRQFSVGMSSADKINLLLQKIPEDILFAKLCEVIPDARSLPTIEPAPAPGGQQGSTVPSHPRSSAGERRLLAQSASVLLWDALTTPRSILRIVATCLGIGLLAGSNFFNGNGLPVGFGIFGGFIGLGAAISLTKTLWRRWHTPTISSARFIGPQPMEEKDAERFYGRDAKIDEIISKLRYPDVRHLLLFGESGCGKTSLLRAGLIPRLRRDYECIYLRFTDNPIRVLREALRAGCPQRINDETLPLVEELKHACMRAGRRLLICIDQFEEFHINPIDGDAYRDVVSFIHSISGEAATIDVRLILCLRQDFLYLLTDFYKDRGFARSEEKVTVEPFEEKIAEEIIQRLLVRDDGRLSWDSDLVRRVLNDLVFQRIQHGQNRRYVLPTELQIVFQMVQSQRLSKAEEYQGKKQLLLDYVSGAIATVPAADPPLVKQLLLSLIDSNGLTKAKPQTLNQLARQVQSREPAHLRRVLDHLDRGRHIVRSFYSYQPNQSTAEKPELRYELAHDYLAGVIRIVAGAEMSGAKRSQALLEMARLRTENDPDYRMPISDCLHMRRFPPERITPEDRVLLRRSLLSFGLRYGLPAMIMLIAGIFIRFGTCTITIQDTPRGNELVFIKGISRLKPFLGGKEPYIASGFESRSFFQLENMSEFVSDLRDGIWRPSGLSFLNKNWNADLYLRNKIIENYKIALFPNTGDCHYKNVIYVGETQQFVALLDAEQIEEFFGQLQERLTCGIHALKIICNDKATPEEQCAKQASMLNTLAEIMGGINSRRHSKDNYMIQFVGKDLISTKENLRIIKYEAEIFVRLLPERPELIKDEDRILIDNIRQWVSLKLNELLKDPHEITVRIASIFDMIEIIKMLHLKENQPIFRASSDFTLEDSLRGILLEALHLDLRHNVKRKVNESLDFLKGAEKERLAHFVQQLEKSPNAAERVEAFEVLAELSPEHPALFSFFNSVILEASEELRSYNQLSSQIISAESELRIAKLEQFQRINEHALRLLLEWSRNGKLEKIKANYLNLITSLQKYESFAENREHEHNTRYSMFFWPKIWSLWKSIEPLEMMNALKAQGQSEEAIFTLLLADPPLGNDQSTAEYKVRLRNEIVENRTFGGRVAGFCASSSIYECDWAQVTLRLNLSNCVSDARLGALLTTCDGLMTSLPQDYARFRLISIPGKLTTEQAEEIARKLLSWLHSSDADRSTVFRSVAVQGFRILAKEQQKESSRDVLKGQLLQQWADKLNQPNTPIRYRIAYSDILRSFDK